MEQWPVPSPARHLSAGIARSVSPKMPPVIEVTITIDGVEMRITDPSGIGTEKYSVMSLEET